MRTSKKHRSWDSKKPARDAGFVHVVSIPWQGQSSKMWNEACANVIEVFGLPGSRFTSQPTMQKMDFHFKSPKDAELCKILLSDHI
jgi:hypothetical protein